MNDIMHKQKFTREQIAERIVEHGDLLVIYSNKIYRLNAWIKHHPGGEMVILHMIGKVRRRRRRRERERVESNFLDHRLGCY